MSATINYGWTKPTVGADDDDWGGILNTAFDDADADLKALADLVAMEKISSGSVSSVSSVDITIPTTYRSHRLYLNGVNPASASTLWLRFDIGSGVVTSSYSSILDVMGHGSTSPTYTATSAASAIALGALQQGSGVGGFAMDLTFPLSGDGSGHPRVGGMGVYSGTTGGSNTHERSFFSGTLATGNRVTSIRLQASTGNISLRYVLMGVKGS
jgi:hypothetical protein